MQRVSVRFQGIVIEDEFNIDTVACNSSRSEPFKLIKTSTKITGSKRSSLSPVTGEVVFSLSFKRCNLTLHQGHEEKIHFFKGSSHGKTLQQQWT